jgi:hypothetical protein
LENADIVRGLGVANAWSRNSGGMVEPWWSTSEFMRDIGATMERPPTFSYEVNVVVVGSFKIHFEVGVFESLVEDGRGMVELVHLALAGRGED